MVILLERVRLKEIIAAIKALPMPRCYPWGDTLPAVQAGR